VGPWGENWQVCGWAKEKKECEIEDVCVCFVGLQWGMRTTKITDESQEKGKAFCR
jgi:hypothetical protein